MTTAFYKLHGAGNDFIFFIDTPTAAQQAASLCHRNKGIGADGVAWLHRTGEDQFRWDFYNSDGSAAEMCGNAARCAMRLVEHLFGLQKMQLETRAGTIYGSVDSEDSKKISVAFDIANTPVQEIESPAGADFPMGYFLTAGVPHCVIPTERPHQLRDRSRELAVFIKNKIFGPAGANITFADLQADPVTTITLERGVEDFTFACGTGVIATAKVHQYLFKKTEPLKLQAPGGLFTVSFEGLRAKLQGPAEFIYKGEL